LSLTVFFAFNKQAFANYYFLVVGTLCCAFAALPLNALDRLALGTPRRFFWQKPMCEPTIDRARFERQRMQHIDGI
jgi:hypothetical protein